LPFREIHSHPPQPRELGGKFFRDDLSGDFGKGSIPEKRRVWHEMVAGVVARSGFPEGFDRAALARAFIAHNDAVKAAIPSRQLLVFDVREGWDPLCAFLGVPVPDDAFPRTNDRVQFGERSQARK